MFQEHSFYGQVSVRSGGAVCAKTSANQESQSLQTQGEKVQTVQVVAKCGKAWFNNFPITVKELFNRN